MVGLAFGELGYCGVRKKILFVIESLGGGGAEKVLTTIVKHIDKEKFDVTVCPIVGTGTYVEEVKRYANYRPILEDAASLSSLQKIWYRIKYKLIYKVLPMSWVYRLWIPKGYDTEVAFCEGFVTKLMAESTNVDAKKIAWVHCDFDRNHWTHSIFKSDSIEYICYKRYSQIITMSETQKRSLSKVFPGLDVKVCYNPIDSAKIIVSSKEVENGISRFKERLRLISIGRLVPVKAFDMLLRVVNRVRNDGCLCELWIIGEGEERRKLEQFITENNLESDVVLFGFQSNPYKYLSLCDIFVCSSVSEGFSTAITEALILGLPVVSTDVSGVREQLTNGCGIVTENDEEAFYQGLKSVIEQPKLLNSMKERAIERGKDFQIVQLMKEIEEVLS